MKSILLFFIYLYTLCFIQAQTPYFKSHSLGETYRNSKIELIHEAQNGLLWVGTSEGLFSYDGLDFTTYLKSDSSSEHVRAIYQDRNSTLWVGYQDGSIYQMKQQRLQTWLPEEGVPVVPITGFIEDTQGHIWIATYGEGVYCYTGQHLYNFNSDDGLLGDDIYVLETDLKGRVWLGTDGGISICSIDGSKKHLQHITRDNGLPDDIIRTLARDEEGNIWIGMYDHGVCFYDWKSQQLNYPLDNWDKGIVSQLEIFEGREIWIGTEGNGLWVLSLLDYQIRKLHTDNEFSTAKIYDLHKDVEGNIWVVSNIHGICHANRQFEFINTAFSNIQAITSDQDNTIWVGTQNGLYIRELDSLGNAFFKPHLSHIALNVVSLFSDDFSNLWIGTFGQGLFIYQPSSKKVKQLTEADGLTNNSILNIDGVNDHVWLATLGGVTEIDVSTNIMDVDQIIHRNFNHESGLGTNFIYKVFIDSQYRIWFATDGKGISVLKDEEEIKNFQLIEHDHGDKKNELRKLKTVYSITEDQRGHIWLSTAKEGIFEFDGVQFQHLTVKEGIRDLEITSLITDIKGNILIVHPNGIDILAPDTRHLIYYDNEVGIDDIDPNLNAVCSDEQGHIWIGCKNGLIKYTPLNEALEIHPRTSLHNVSIFLESIDFQNKNTFNYDENSLVFDYFGLWYTDPTTVGYRYQLEGYDHNWISSKDRKATYSNLPSGDYLFKVTSTENGAWLDEPIIEYAFKIYAPIWQRWWFIFLSSIFLIGLFYWYLKRRDQRLQKVSFLEKEKVESQFETLKSQINPHFLFNNFNTLVNIIEEQPEAAVEYVEQLSDFYRFIMQYRDKEVISIQEEIKLVNNYYFLLKKRFESNINLEIIASFNESTFVVPLAIQMLVENAIKHNIISKSKPLRITISTNPTNEYIVVSNNLQLKFTPEQSTQFGLQSLEKRYALISGKKVIVLKTVDTFQVKIPIIK